LLVSQLVSAVGCTLYIVQAWQDGGLFPVDGKGWDVLHARTRLGLLKGGSSGRTIPDIIPFSFFALIY
jgi:hypothetical protein